MQYIFAIFIMVISVGCNGGAESVTSQQTPRHGTAGLVGGACEYKSVEVNATVTFLDAEHAIFEAEQAAPQELYLFKENSFELKSSEYKDFDALKANAHYTLYFDVITKGTCTPNIFKSLKLINEASEEQS